MEDLLEDLIGTQVELRSISGTTEHVDRGTLEGCGGGWCRLRVADGFVLCFPVRYIRLVKGRPVRAGLPIPAAPGDSPPPAEDHGEQGEWGPQRTPS